MNSGDNTAEHEADARRLKCGDIQAVLFDYMTRELGAGRSELVREHLRKCTACQKEAAEIGEMVDALRGASKGGAAIEEHLSEARRKRLVRSCMHPVLDWVYSHHILMSVLAALIVLLAALGMLLKTKVWSIEPPDPGHTVIIGKGHPPGVTNSAAGGDEPQE